MTWQIALGLFYVTVIGQSLLQRSYSQKSKLPESFPPAISYIIGVVPLGGMVGLLLNHHVHWSWWLAALLAIEGIFIGLYNWLSFIAIRRLPLARFQTLFQSYEIVVIALGWSILGEKLTVNQIVGGLLLLGAALLAIRAPRNTMQETRRGLPQSAVIITFAAAIAMGVGLVTEKAALRHMDIGAYFIFGYATQALAVLLFASKDVNRQSLHTIKSYDLKRMFAMGVLSATTGFFYIAAIVKSNNISLITALSAFTLPLTVVCAYLFLHERDNQKLLWTAMALGFLGLLATALH